MSYIETESKPNARTEQKKIEPKLTWSLIFDGIYMTIVALKVWQQWKLETTYHSLSLQWITNTAKELLLAIYMWSEGNNWSELWNRRRNMEPKLATKLATDECLATNPSQDNSAFVEDMACNELNSKRINRLDINPWESLDKHLCNMLCK